MTGRPSGSARSSHLRWPARAAAILSTAAVLGGLLCAAAAAQPRQPHAVGSQSDVSYDAQFIQFLQRPDGSILSSPSGNWIEPYLANYAAWGLARAAAFTSTPSYDAAAWRWLQWYAGHQSSSGYVDDYKRSGDDFVDSDTSDSTDGTSGIYLLAVWAASTEVPGQLTHLRRLWPSVRLAVSAIESTFASDGLTWALPTWHVKYLMDNSEALGGLDAAYAMARLMHDSSLASRARGDAIRIQRGIGGLWDPATNAYDWARHENGDVATNDWSVLYPDSVEQAWAVAFGAVPSDRAVALMSTLHGEEPNWDQPTATANYYDGTVYPHEVDFWSIVGWAFAAVGDANGAADGAANIRAGAWAMNRQLPFTDGFEGQLIRLETGASDMPARIAAPVAGG